MALKYISDLTGVTTISDTDVLVIDDGSHNYKIAWSAFKILLGTVAGFGADPDQETYPGFLRITLANGNFFRAKVSDPSKQDLLTFDDSPTENSSNPVKSGGIYAALSGKLDVEDYTNFTGATGQEDGEAGKVPAPAAGGERYLSSSGAWQAPDSAPTEDSNYPVTSGALYLAVLTINGNFSGDYSASETYALGAYCLHEGVLYRCTTAIATAEEWTAAHWTQTTVMSEVLALAAAIAASVSSENITYDGTASSHTAGSVAAELAGLGTDDADQELTIQLILNDLVHRKAQDDTRDSQISTLQTTAADHGSRLTTAEGNITSQGGRITTLEQKATADEANITKLLARTEIEAGTVTLTNTSAFPFNDSQVTVPLVTERDNQNYIVDYEVTAAVGNVCDIIISGKLVNGFKIEHTGSATSVTVKYQVLGGMA